MRLLSILNTQNKAGPRPRAPGLHSPLDAVAHRMTSDTRVGDLNLPKEARHALRRISAQMRARRRLFRRVRSFASSHGNEGVGVIFAGGSHRDRTLAAAALANDLGYDLYHIDLSKVVTKYISETEENLRNILDRAEKPRVILLFDEADALFGQRAGQALGHDRHGSIETSYLLNRIERFRGLAILATNAKPMLEPAVMRRIRYIVDFDFPEAEKQRSKERAPQ
jgi:SpoVK/Ycf46/Vps4 family AAA+-type ATPase